jgi:MYXO-CTERM domain-containing protein
VTLAGPLAGTDALSVSGANLSNTGDFGGPLLCDGNAVAIFSSFEYDGTNTIIENAYQPLSGAIKTWLDEIVAGDTATSSPGRGNRGSSSDGSTSAPPIVPPAASPPGDAPTNTTSNSGCSVQRGASEPMLGWLFGVVVLAASRSRRRRAER